MAKEYVYVYHVVNCSPLIKRFASTKAADRWKASFAKKYKPDDDSNYIEFTFVGRITQTSPYYAEMV